jgi:hypothetical protein
MVTHIPTRITRNLINGEIPLLLTDTYIVAGCPFFMGNVPSPCMKVNWLSPSTTRIIEGVPVLLNTSIGICQSAAGVAQGPANIISFQTREPE